MKVFLCTVKGCINQGRYCRIHPGGSLKKKEPIAPRSEKLDKVMKKEYVPQVKEMVAANTECKVKSPVCTGMAQGYHHPSGRIGKKLMDPKRIPCCNLCNLFIEQNDAWARANGWKESKHKDFKREK